MSLGFLTEGGAGNIIREMKGAQGLFWRRPTENVLAAFRKGHRLNSFWLNITPSIKKKKQLLFDVTTLEVVLGSRPYHLILCDSVGWRKESIFFRESSQDFLITTTLEPEGRAALVTHDEGFDHIEAITKGPVRADERNPLLKGLSLKIDYSISSNF